MLPHAVKPHWYCRRLADGISIYYDGDRLGEDIRNNIRLIPDDKVIGFIKASLSSSCYQIEYPPIVKVDEGEHSGGSVNYYKVQIDHPDSAGIEPYQAECTDIIEALGMTFAEANIFKEVWRTAAARTLGKKKAGHDALYGAEKIEYYAARNLRKVKRNSQPS